MHAHALPFLLAVQLFKAIAFSGALVGLIDETGELK